jgi:hypothetical protein
MSALFPEPVCTAAGFELRTWDPGAADRSAAWQLRTELWTRITTQALAYRSGVEATALKSVYELFGITRELIKKYEGCYHFATLTVDVLNWHVRPFTARWHLISDQGRLESSDTRFDFRRELAELQPKLRVFARLLDLLAGVPPAADDSGASDARDLSWISTPLPFGIQSRGGEQATLVGQINEKEREEIGRRREFYELPTAAAPTDAVGLSISGGGIRSATLALGIVQVLARQGILHQVDFLSTVSGGGYLGSFLSTFLNDDDATTTLKPDSAETPRGGDQPGISCQPFGALHEGESSAVRRIRNHSKFLSEGGIRTVITGLAMVTYGVFASVMLLLPFVLAAVLLSRLSENIPSYIDTWTHGWVPQFAGLLPIAVFLAWILVIPAIQNWNRGGRAPRWPEHVGIVLAVLLVLWAFVAWIPALYLATGPYTTLPYEFAAAIGAMIILGGLGLILELNAAARFALQTMYSIVALAMLLLAAFELYALLGGLSLLSVSGIFLGSLLYASVFLDLNSASPRRFYRNRLARTYLLQRTPSGGVDPVAAQPISGLNAGPKAPYHLINAALNIPGSDNPGLRGRNTDFFVFSKHFFGSPSTLWQPTAQWERADSHLDLGTAMAISGAAAASHMGTQAASRYAFLLAMLNVRLGYWARRPNEADVKAAAEEPKPPPKWHYVRPPIGWLYFFRELTGRMRETYSHLNLSDGGHIENLGIYELLRRRCKFIVAIDGEADPERTFGGLLTLTGMASIDLGVDIGIELKELQLNKRGYCESHFCLWHIRYGTTGDGLLLYLKSSLTGNESEFIKKYHAEHPLFPHESTAQQLYSETQFEAYRALGEHMANDLFRQDLVNEWTVSDPVAEWFRRLANNLIDLDDAQVTARAEATTPQT